MPARPKGIPAQGGEGLLDLLTKAIHVFIMREWMRVPFPDLIRLPGRPVHISFAISIPWIMWYNLSKPIDLLSLFKLISY